jgi:hypothetical protein
VPDKWGRPGLGARPQRWVVTPSAAVLALIVAGAGAAEAQDVGFTASLFFARTSGPGATFDSTSVFNSVDLGRGPLRVTFSIPFGRYHSVIEPGVNPVDGTVLPGTDTTATGFGDPLIRADVRVIDNPSRGLSLSVAGSIKPPVADPAEGLGTGEMDYAVGASLYRAMGRTALLADALYWVYGDPDGVDYLDGLSFSTGVARTLSASGRWSTLVTVSGFTAGYGDLSAPVQVNVGLLTLVGRRHSLAVSAGIGVTESASDFSVGASWRISR